MARPPSSSRSARAPRAGALRRGQPRLGLADRGRGGGQLAATFPTRMWPCRDAVCLVLAAATDHPASTKQPPAGGHLPAAAGPWVTVPLVLAVALLAMFLTHLVQMLELVGALVGYVAFVLPALCYLHLQRATGPGADCPSKPAAWRRMLAWLLLVAGVAVAVGSTARIGYQLLYERVPLPRPAPRIPAFLGSLAAAPCPSFWAPGCNLSAPDAWCLRDRAPPVSPALNPPCAWLGWTEVIGLRRAGCFEGCSSLQRDMWGVR